MGDLQDTTPPPARNDPQVINSNSNHVDHVIFTLRNVLVAIKLDDKNFIIWKHQIQKILRILGIENYVFQEPQNKFQKDGSVNPNYKWWKKRDEILGCWLMSSMNDDMIKQIYGFDTCRDAWMRLEKLHSSKLSPTREWIVDVSDNPSDYELERSCTIYTVPQNIKDINQEYFTPKIVSIGPFHFHKIRDLDYYKKRYLFRLLKVISVNEGHRDTARVYDRLIESMKSRVPEAKSCYSFSGGLSEGDAFDSHEFLKDEHFAEMMVLDGCFVIELLRLFHLSKEEPVDDPIFNTPWMLPTLQRDLLKLENQLPFFVLQDLFELTRVENQQHLPLVHLVILFFDPLLPRENPICRLRYKVTFDHMLDVFRSTFLSSVVNNMISESNPEDQFKPLYHSATELQEVGIKIKSRKDYDLLDIDFKNGYLEIPPLLMNDGSVRVFLNFVAYEQCHDKAKPFFSNFFFFFDSLVNFHTDVEILRRNEIMDHALGSDEQVATLLNRLGREIVCSSDLSYISKQIKEVNRRCKKFYASKRRQCWRNMISLYFSSPWSFLSVCAAIILLILTTLQTVYTMISYHHPT